MIQKTSCTIPSRLANQRAHYEEQTIYDIIDEALFCTVSYAEEGQPFSIPQSIVRVNNDVYIHGSVGSHFIRSLADGRPVCICVMLADDIVVAKTAFHHSINYRSVVIFSKGILVENEAEKYTSFKTLTEKMVPGSWDYLKPMTAKEMAKTSSVKFSLDEASAKIRNWGPGHEEDEMDLPIWTGLIPIKPLRQKAIADEEGMKHPLPEHLK